MDGEDVAVILTPFISEARPSRMKFRRSSANVADVKPKEDDRI